MVLAASEPVILCDDIIPAAVNAPLRSYADAISGGFSYRGKPCSILVAWGKVIYGAACHAHIGKPESVLYRLTDGYIGIRRVKTASELPKNVKWAVGGAGLLDMYAPKQEGFAAQYADVLRRTSHTFTGTHGDKIVLGYVKSMTAEEVNAYVKRMGLDHAIMLDGGHVAAINSAATKINTTATQHSIIQGV